MACEVAVFSKQFRIRDTLVTIRNAEEADAQALVDMMNRMDAESDFLTREPGEFMMTAEREAKFIASRKESPSFRFMVAEVDGVLVGVADAYYQTKARYRHVGEVSIAISKAFWGKGIGRAMLEEGIGWLAENGVEKIHLTVDASNLRAISLYLKLGFCVVGTIPDYKKMRDGAYHNGYIMVLDVASRQK